MLYSPVKIFQSEVMITFASLQNQGRLGNQLWQIASTVGVARRVNDVPIFPEWIYQPYFNVPSEFFSLEPPLAISNVQNFVKYLPPEAIDYLQDYSLWSSISREIQNYFSPSQVVLDEFKKDQYAEFLELPRPILSVHVRRGDNANEGEWKADYHPLRPMSYYHEAIKQYEGNISSMVIFSDDPSWCKHAFNDYQFAYIFEGGSPSPKEHEPEYKSFIPTDWIDFFAMVQCDYHIISNSTFAWWAAYLGSDGKSVTYPSPWFGPALSMINADLMFPDHWNKINHG